MADQFKVGDAVMVPAIVVSTGDGVVIVRPEEESDELWRWAATPDELERRPSPKPAAPVLAQISMTLDEAEAFANGLSDVLCWATGFAAAGGEGPLSMDKLRELRAALLDAAHRARGGKETDLPF